MQIGIQCHDDGRVPEQMLHLRRWQLAAVALLGVDAPRSEEVAEGMQSVFRPVAVAVDHASGPYQVRPARWRGA